MFKTPSPKMAGFITVALLFMFGVVLFTPLFKPGAEFDAAMSQTLLVLLVGSVGYYLGSSKSSDEKNQVIATQANTAATAAGAPIGTGPADPAVVKIDDATPVKVQESKP